MIKLVKYKIYFEKNKFNYSLSQKFLIKIWHKYEKIWNKYEINMIKNKNMVKNMQNMIKKYDKNMTQKNF